MTGEGRSKDEQPRPSPGLPQRLIDTVFSPGRMGEAVAAHPRWFGALSVSAVLISLSIALIPVDLFIEVQRQTILEAGGTAPDMSGTARTVIRWASILGSGVGFILISFIAAGLTTVLFAFILGDEGGYKQYLALGAHASFIPALAGLMLAPLRIVAEDPQLTLSLGTFAAPVLGGGYLLSVLRIFDLTQVWSLLVTAQGIHAIDRRRSFGSAATILLSVLLIVALGLGFVIPS